MTRQKMPCLAPCQTGYLMIPTDLLACASPIAIGVYALLAWLWHLHPDGLCISANSIAQYGGIRPGTARSTLTSLCTRGWIMMEANGTRTSHLTPSWGSGRGGKPRLWQRDKKCYGRPDKTTFLKVDSRIISWSLGKITLIPNKGVDIERSFVIDTAPTPLLTLEQIGTYILALHGKAAPAQYSLMQLGLLDAAGQAQSLPPTRVQFLATIATASIQFENLPTPVPATLDHIKPTKPEQTGFDDLIFFWEKDCMHACMHLCMLILDPLEEQETCSTSNDSVSHETKQTRPCTRSVDHESQLINPPYPPLGEPIDVEEELVQLYQQTNPYREIFPSEWQDLKTIITQYGIDSTKEILNRVQNRRRGGKPWQIFPEYIMSSLRRQAEQKYLTQHSRERQQSVSDSGLFAVLEGIQARDQIIRADWADVDTVTTWRKRMQLMQSLGYQMRNPDAWLARQLINQTDPPSEAEVRARYGKPQSTDLWEHPTAAGDTFARVFGREEPLRDAASTVSYHADEMMHDHHPASAPAWHEPEQRPSTAVEATDTLRRRLAQRGWEWAAHLTIPCWHAYPDPSDPLVVLASTLETYDLARMYAREIRRIVAEMADLDPQYCEPAIRYDVGVR